VPAGHVVIDKKPHDCEFSNAPIGSKHCHYGAQSVLVSASDSADGQKTVMVGYEKIEE
jgi:hypothetical protein